MANQHEPVPVQRSTYRDQDETLERLRAIAARIRAGARALVARSAAPSRHWSEPRDPEDEEPKPS